MVNNSYNKNSNQKCFQCGSELIFVSQETVQPEGMRYPQIDTVYRCSNGECQKQKDKDKVDRQRIRLKKVEMDKKRIETLQEKRKLGREARIKETEN
jgi:hypothetical protein